MNWTIWDKSQKVTYTLLLEADSSEKQIAKYLDKSHVFQLMHDD
ncbi:N-acetyltransferase, partial [Escherichia coli]|nr:N-acetyltransferase [Escherichia coli]